MRINALVAAGAVLRWLPEPLIAAAGCHHQVITYVEVADGASLVWRDDQVCGRHGESAGDVRTDTTIRYGGRTLYRHELAIGPGAPGWSGAAVLGGGRAVGSVVLAGPGLPNPALLGGDAAVMALTGPGVLATAVGQDIRQVRAALDPICAGYPAHVSASALPGQDGAATHPEPEQGLLPAAF
jgi:urease accessory protein